MTLSSTIASGCVGVGSAAAVAFTQDLSTGQQWTLLTLFAATLAGVWKLAAMIGSRFVTALDKNTAATERVATSQTELATQLRTFTDQARDANTENARARDDAVADVKESLRRVPGEVVRVLDERERRRRGPRPGGADGGLRPDA